MTVLALVVALAAGQVAGVCSAGKNCTVRSIKTTANGNAAVAQCLGTGAGNNSWGWTADGISFSANRYNGASCDNTQVALFGYSNSTVTWNTYNSVAMSVSGKLTAQVGMEAPVTFASFPTCNAGAAGRLLYDSTNSVWRACDGAGAWVPQSRVQASGVCIRSSGGTQTDDCGDGQIFGTAYAEAGKNYIGKITCGWSVAGTGAKAVVRVVSAANPAVDCRCDLGACTGTGGTCTCDQFFPTGAISLQYLKANLDGGIASNCTVNPARMYCTVN